MQTASVHVSDKEADMSRPGCSEDVFYRSTKGPVDSEEVVTGNMTQVAMHGRKAAADVQFAQCNPKHLYSQ